MFASATAAAGGNGKIYDFLKKSGALYRIINSEWTKEAADGLKSKEQFSQLVIQYERLVYTICFQLVRSAPAAEDLTQETFLAAYLHRDTMPEGYERQWLGRIAANKSKDYLKSAYCRKVQLSADGETPGLYLLDPSPEDVYIEKEQEEAVRRQVLELKEPYHLISVLYFLEDKTVEEIARTVGRPVKTVQTQLYRAKVMLKKRLKEERLRE